MQGQISKINHLLKDLWDASETPAFVFNDRVQLHEVVGRVLLSLKDGFAAKNIEVQCRVPDSLPWMTVDKFKFDRLFELLLQDELVSLPAGSQINLTAEAVAGSTPGQTTIVVRVRDNGPGLPQEALRLIFDPFVVRSDSPMEYGINLMACYFIVHHHSGKIEAQSEPGHGTLFTLRFPTSPEQSPACQESEAFLEKVFLNDTVWEKLLASD